MLGKVCLEQCVPGALSMMLREGSICRVGKGGLHLHCICSLYTGNKLGEYIIVLYRGSPSTLSLQYETIL